ncbi:MAG TPA: AzlD domain-containing protein [Acidimicrobiia bacterium]|jgi:branched-subunit amino acid transport protein
MSPAAALIAILAVGLGSYIMRAVFIIALANREIPPSVVSALEYVAPAVLASLVVSLVVDAQGRLTIGIPEILALVAGSITVWRSRNYLLSTIVGMAVLWIVSAIA